MTEFLSPAREPSDRKLLCAPAKTTQERSACMDLLTGTELSDERVLFISYLFSPEDLLTRWENHAETLPAAFGFILANERTRSTTTSDPDINTIHTDPSGIPVTIKTISPDNLTKLGVHIVEILKKWEAADELIAVCFDSLTALNNHVNEKTLLRFLHVLNGHLQTVDAQAHFHLDPAAINDQTIAKIKTTMDTVHRVTADNE